MDLFRQLLKSSYPPKTPSMSSKSKPPDDDEEGIVSSKKPKHKSSSAKKPPKPFITRAVRRLRDGCDYFIESMDDMEKGYRDKNGKKTQKGIERDYERERRRKKKDAERREEKMSEGGRDGEGGVPVEAVMSGGRGGPPHHGEHSHRGGGREGPSRHGERSRRGAHYGEEGGVRWMDDEDPFNPPPMREGPDRGRGSHHSGGFQRDISPIPSEQSTSSIRARVSARRNEERVRTRSQAGREHPVDSEDEERPGSFEGSSFESEEYNEAPKAARARGRAGGPAEEPALPGISSVRGSRGPPAEGRSSGLRGGGAGKIEDLDDDSVEASEYNEYEDFDDEYATAAGASGLQGGDDDGIEDLDDDGGEAQGYGEHEDFDDEYTTSSGSSHARDSSSDESEGEFDVTDERHNEQLYKEARQEGKQKERCTHKPSQENLRREGPKMSQSRERRPYSVKAQGIIPESVTGFLPRTQNSDRIPRPYANPNVSEWTRVGYPEAQRNAGASHQQRSDKAKKPILTQNESASSTDSYFCKNYPTPEPHRRGRYKTAEYSEVRRHYRARTGVLQEAEFEYNKPGRAGPADPRMWNIFGHEKNANLDANLDAGSYKGNFVPYRPGGQGSQPRGKVPKNQASPLRNETYVSPGDPQGSDPGHPLDSSSGSSDTEPEPSPRETRKAPPKPSYSSDDSESPPSKTGKAKAKAGKRYKSPPPPKQSRANQGKRRATAYSPPPPKYNDVVKESPPNHYARLGLKENATADEIKKACKKMRVKTHPDQVKREHPEMTEEEMVKVTAIAAKVGEAADVLGNPSQKWDYDDMIRAWKRKDGGRLPREDV
ncbi:MAG: hypothetical protein Q9221_001832 [Calogaya cf. arnoldii]